MGLKIRYNSPVILTFSLICVAVHFIPLTTYGAPLSHLFVVGDRPINDDLFSLFLYVFGHADIGHLMGNLTFILLLGPIIEEKYGSNRTLIMLVITAVVTGLLNIFLFDTGLLGASGIVFMLIVLVSFTNVRSGEIPLTFILVMLLFLGKEIIQSVDTTDNISQFAHIIGGILGGFFGFVTGKKEREVDSRYL